MTKGTGQTTRSLDWPEASGQKEMEPKGTPKTMNQPGERAEGCLRRREPGPAWLSRCRPARPTTDKDQDVNQRDVDIAKGLLGRPAGRLGVARHADHAKDDKEDQNVEGVQRRRRLLIDAVAQPTRGGDGRRRPSGEMDGGSLADVKGGRAYLDGVHDDHAVTFHAVRGHRVGDGKTVNFPFGMAIHDDHTVGRYHHVSMGFKLGIGTEGDIEGREATTDSQQTGTSLADERRVTAGAPRFAMGETGLNPEVGIADYAFTRGGAESPAGDRCGWGKEGSTPPFHPFDRRRPGFESERLFPAKPGSARSTSGDIPHMLRPALREMKGVVRIGAFDSSQAPGLVPSYLHELRRRLPCRRRRLQTGEPTPIRRQRRTVHLVRQDWRSATA